MTSASVAVYATKEDRLTDMEKLTVGYLQLIEIHFLYYLHVTYMGFYKCLEYVLFILPQTHTMLA
jgi:hypothetical protein